MRENRDAHVGHGDDIGRGSGRLHARLLDFGERLVVVGKDDTGAKGAHDEEETETPVDSLEGVLDVDTRALGFGSHHGDVLRSDNTESLKIPKKFQKSAFLLQITTNKREPTHSRPHTREEPLKSPQATTGKVLCKGTGFVPVPKAVGITGRVSAHHGDEGEGEQNEDQDDLAC